jgi:hypothetical protein
MKQPAFRLFKYYNVLAAPDWITRKPVCNLFYSLLSPSMWGYVLKTHKNIIYICIRTMNILTGGKFYVVILLPGARDYFIQEMKENHKIYKILLTFPFVSSEFFPVREISLSFRSIGSTPRFISRRIQT